MLDLTEPADIEETIKEEWRMVLNKSPSMYRMEYEIFRLGYILGIGRVIKSLPAKGDNKCQ
jgi:hypothetical protein